MFYGYRLAPGQVISTFNGHRLSIMYMARVSSKMRSLHD